MVPHQSELFRKIITYQAFGHFEKNIRIFKY
jgi:hypothetical protein